MEHSLKFRNEVITINGHPTKKIYGGFADNQPCILSKQVAELHDYHIGTINRIVKKSIDKFDKGFHIIDLKSEMKSSRSPSDDPNHPIHFLINSGFYATIQAVSGAKHIYLFSQEGYRLLCESLKSVFTKQIYEQVIRDYFSTKGIFEADIADNQAVGDIFDLSVKRFKTALEAVKLMEMTENNAQAIRIANEITRESTQFDLMAFILHYCSRESGLDSVVPPKGKKSGDDEMYRFFNAWWYKYSDNSVTSRELYRVIVRNKISLDLGSGSKRSQKVRLNIMLSEMTDKQIGNYRIVNTGKDRGILMWKLEDIGG